MDTIKNMAEILHDAEAYLENLNRQKDEALFDFIRNYWPRRITPNHLTIARMAIGSILFYLLFFVHDSNSLVILPLFFMGIVTDLLDGAVARCLHKETHFGEVADPIADRMIIVPVAIYALLANPLLLVILMTTEILNAFTSLLAAGKKIFFGSNIFGKVKMFLQSIVLLTVLAFWPSSPNMILTYLLWLSIGFMVISLSHKFSEVKSYYLKHGKYSRI
jgi:CDP-diacylglycerol--glycerol-3-phosphate 3-phosphatidyltransferase